MTRYFPPEWYRQSCVQITWPHKDTDWGDYLDEAEKCFLNIANEVTKREKLIIVGHDIDRIKKLTFDLPSDKVIYFDAINNDTWARDHGGITVFENRMPKILNYRFNGWGQKFPSNYDNQITRLMYEKGIFADLVKIEHHHDLVLEGGSIETDGEGSLLTTTRCLLSLNRNEHLSQKEIEQRLKRDLGIDVVHWLTHGFLEGDDTDSHIDTLARFCNGNTICYVKCYSHDDIHYEELTKMEDELKSIRRPNGGEYNLVPIPLPDPIYYNGERLPATYANFLIINDAVLVPIYGCQQDGEAIDILKSVFTDREIVPVDCSVLIRQHGSLHCVTMQYPVGVIDE
ncbi:MAG: agmatine deiminase family protein [Calditerrivibrio sp.]|nr:agmatine deiminase family protein [Calditerrivibrio sp.]